MQALPTMSKYEAYKPSGIDWLEEIPETWLIIPAKRKHRVLKLINKRNKYRNVLSLTLRGVVNNNLDNPEGLVPRDYASYQIFEKDDLVFKLIDLENLKTSRVGIVHEQGIMSPAYIRLEINEQFCPKYAYYYFYNLYLNAVYNNLGQGVRSTLGPSDLLEIPIIQPRYEEQIAIASFLDNRLAQIDEAIAVREKTITLLKERKQIIVQQVVTQGLNPNVPMKESGADWIGQIPEHWEVKKLRYLGRTQNGISAGAEYFGEGYPFVSYGDVYKNRQLPKVVDGLAKSSFSDQRLYSVRSGDVFFTRTSETIDEIGFASICFNPIDKATFAGFLIRFRPTSKRLTKEFSKYYFNAAMMREYFVKEMNLVIRASLSQELLKNVLVALPPVSEQMKIFEYLENMSEKIDDSIELQIEQIGKLREYKTTLINSAVTGKIKVA